MSESNLILVIGGAASGKSLFAESLAAKGRNVTYIATAKPVDVEMEAKIENHKKRRPADWRTIELNGPNLLEVLAEESSDCILLDALTIYVADVMSAVEDPENHLSEVASALQRVEGKVIVVSDEVGMGLVPNSPPGRIFRNLLGSVNRQIAQVADSVYFVAAGLPMTLKDKGLQVVPDSLSGVKVGNRWV